MGYIDFYMNAIKIKNIKRSGWVNKKVPNPESVADHSFGVVLLALTIDLPEGVSRDELVSMAVVHDLGECEVGDIVWENGRISHIEKQVLKHEEEQDAIKKLFEKINNFHLEKQGIEYFKQNTKTSRFLKELDKLEMVFQALVYEQFVEPSSLDEFWENADKYIKTREVRELFEELKRRRA